MRILGPMLVAGMAFATAAGLQAANVGLIQIRGPIGPATASYISRAVALSEQQKDACLVIELDTPGGLVDSTRQIVQTFYDSRVPIVVYVAPEPARAASAGTFITLAADVAAMAPFTTIGAAHPVSLGIGGSEGGETNSVMGAKMENDVASFVRNIARKRGRNVDWAESAVRKSVSITADEALKLHVIDLIAADIPDLLRQLDGREVGGRRLHTAGARVVPIPMSAGEKLFQTLWRPEVMFLLMLVAIYGIIGEINHPGAIVPGVVGAIALVVFLYMTTILPVSVAGVALIVLAVILFAIDVYTPTHGVLTAGGVVSFFLGSLLLFHRTPGFNLPLTWILPATVVTALFFLFVVGAGLRAQRLPVRAGRETMIGQEVKALERIDSRGGKVFIEGEYWNAVSESPVESGQPVEITGIEGLTLKVKPKIESKPCNSTNS